MRASGRPYDSDWRRHYRRPLSLIIPTDWMDEFRGRLGLLQERALSMARIRIKMARNGL